MDMKGVSIAFLGHTTIGTRAIRKDQTFKRSQFNVRCSALSCEALVLHYVTYLVEKVGKGVEHYRR